MKQWNKFRLKKSLTIIFYGGIIIIIIIIIVIDIVVIIIINSVVYFMRHGPTERNGSIKDKRTYIQKANFNPTIKCVHVTEWTKEGHTQKMHTPSNPYEGWFNKCELNLIHNNAFSMLKTIVRIWFWALEYIALSFSHMNEAAPKHTCPQKISSYYKIEMLCFLKTIRIWNIKNWSNLEKIKAYSNRQFSRQPSHVWNNLLITHSRRMRFWGENSVEFAPVSTQVISNKINSNK